MQTCPGLCPGVSLIEDQLSAYMGHNSASPSTFFSPHLCVIQVRPVVPLDPVSKSVTNGCAKNLNVFLVRDNKIPKSLQSSLCVLCH